jgi:hypothetical protein
LRIELGRQRILVLDTRQRLRRRIFAGGCHDEHTRKRVRRARVHAPVQDPLAIRVERLELVFRKIHHDAFGELFSTMFRSSDAALGMARLASAIRLCRSSRSGPRTLHQK